MIIVTSSCFQNDFRPHRNEKPLFSNSSGLKSVVEKLRFNAELAWTLGLTVEIKLRFQISPASSRHSLSFERIAFLIIGHCFTCLVDTVCFL